MYEKSKEIWGYILKSRLWRESDDQKPVSDSISFHLKSKRDAVCGGKLPKEHCFLCFTWADLEKQKQKMF